MSEFLAYGASFGGGALLGLVLFSGLWLTIKRIERAPHPAMRLLLSMLLRFTVVLAGFSLIAHYGDWAHLVSALLGFTLLRIYMVRRISSRQQGDGEVPG